MPAPCSHDDGRTARRRLRRASRPGLTRRLSAERRPRSWAGHAGARSVERGGVRPELRREAQALYRSLLEAIPAGARRPRRPERSGRVSSSLDPRHVARQFSASDVSRLLQTAAHAAFLRPSSARPSMRAEASAASSWVRRLALLPQDETWAIARKEVTSSMVKRAPGRAPAPEAHPHPPASAATAAGGILLARSGCWASASGDGRATDRTSWVWEFRCPIRGATDDRGRVVRTRLPRFALDAHHRIENPALFGWLRRSMSNCASVASCRRGPAFSAR